MAYGKQNQERSFFAPGTFVLVKSQLSGKAIRVDKNAVPSEILTVFFMANNVVLLSNIFKKYFKSKTPAGMGKVIFPKSVKKG